MHKLFGPLYLIVVSAILLTIALLWLLRLDNNYLEGLYYKGTFHLLDERLKQAEDEQLELAHVQSWFTYEITLQPLVSYTFKPEHIDELTRGNSVVIEIDDADFIYRMSNTKPGYVWSIQTEIMDKDEQHDIVIGSALILEDYLKPFPETEWPAKLSAIESQFGFPMTLVDANEFRQTLPNEDKERLDKHRVVIPPNSYFDTFYYRLNNSNSVVIIGPLPLGWFWSVVAWTNNILIAILLIFGLVLAVLMLLWLWPLWKNLLSLNSAAEQFGDGNFDTRVKIGKFSPISLLSTSFNSMAERIQSLIVSHKELTNSVSHELRTPLARMKFSLAELVETDDPKQRQHFYQEIATDINELDALINEMLVYATFERVKPNVEFSSIELSSWIEKQFERAKNINNKQEYRCNTRGIEQGDVAKFESKLLSRALSNLLMNASRYANGIVQLSVINKNTQLLFIVEDNGIGVPDEARETIFEPFKRVDTSRDRDTGGYGLGLAIVKQIAEWHKGSCTIKSSSLGGAKFTLTIPQ